jgi:hypothetical protein
MINERLNFQYYDFEDHSHNKLKDDKELIKFLTKKTDELKKYYIKTIMNMTNNFEYTYTLGSTYIRDEINFNDKSEYSKFIENKYNSSVGEQTLQDIIYFVINDMDDFFNAEIKKIKNENMTQWNS